MKEWKDFRDECPNVGDIIEWDHCQGLGEKPEVVEYWAGIEWIEGDLWRKVR